MTDENKKLEPKLNIKKHPLSSEVFSSDLDDEIPETVRGPSDYAENVQSSLEGVTLSRDAETIKWGGVVAEGAQTASYDSQFVSSLNAHDALFEQELDVNGQKLHIDKPKLKPISNQILTGDKALHLIRNTFGLGAMVRVPAYHSGFWLTFTAPSDGQILELHRLITQDKIDIGRASYGLAFSNQVVYFASRLLDFALTNLHSHSIKTDKDIRDFIYCHDIPVIIWGIACSIWPNGFNYERACTAKPEECKHVVTELLNLSKLLWTNTASLNAWQKNHMTSKTTASMNEEDVVRYRKELLNNQSRVVSIGEDTKLTLKVPTANQWIESGTKWINEIADSITTSLSSTDSLSERNNHMINVAKSQALRQYSHWIEKIHIDTNTFEDPETIENSLAVLSSKNSVRKEIVTQVKKYIDDTTISLIGVPSYDCPNCHGSQLVEEEDSYPKFKNIIPIDVFNTFFIPVVQRVIMIQNR